MSIENHPLQYRIENWLAVEFRNFATESGIETPAEP